MPLAKNNMFGFSVNMIKVTPKIITNYTKACGADYIIQTKPVSLKAYKPFAELSYEEQFCPSKFWSFISTFKLPKEYRGKKYMFINHLISNEKGAGTRAVKKVVRESIKRGHEGRVAVNAAMIDPERGHPMLFYYKLGFRSENKFLNIVVDFVMKKFKKWDMISLGSLFSARSELLYLPKENVKHCLNYMEASKFKYAPEMLQGVFNA